MGIVLALLSSVLWGIGDFAGGTASRRFPTLVVVLVSQLCGLVLVVGIAAATGAWSAPTGYIPWAIGAGLAGVAGLVAFYQSLAAGTMGVVSPIAALGVIVPVAVGLATGHVPSAIVMAGIAVALVGVVAASGPERAAGRSIRPVLLAAVAAVCFGATLLFIAEGADSSPVMTMVVMRIASVATLTPIVLVARSRLRADGAARRSARWWAVIAIAGLADVGANLTFAFASNHGAITVIAILGSLYPAVTVLLARVIHGERMTRLQQSGVVAALVGVALIAGWS